MRLPLFHAGRDEVVEVVDLHPSKIVGIGRNYRAHAAELGNPMPSEPVIFFKPPSALIASGEPIRRPAAQERVDYEGELAVVIGRRARRVRAADALDFVMGLCCGNDVTARALQKQGGPWARAKGMDGFCPLGPRLVAGLDPSDLALETRLNGRVVQSGRTSDLAFPIPTLIEFVSAEITLEPGDVILTGTPAGVGNLSVGDQVEVEIEGIGTLVSPVVEG